MNTKKIIIAGGALVVVAGILFLYFKHKKSSASPTGIDPSTMPNTSASDNTMSATAPNTDNPAKNALLTRYVGQPKQLAAINSADAKTIRQWSSLLSMWDAQWPSSKIYATALDGVSAASSYDNSIGKWWELFSQRNGF